MVLGILTHLRNEDYRSDVRIWQDAVAKAPDNPRAHNNLGHALIEQGRVDEGIIHCQKAVEIDPNRASAHNNLGRALVQQGRVDEAIAHYRKALEIDPADAQFHHNLGHALVQQGNVDEAITHGQKAREIRKKTRGEKTPQYAESLNNLALMYQNVGDYARAESLCRQAMEIWKEVLGEKDPDYAAGLNNLALLYHSMGDYVRAEPLFRQALDINPNDANAHFNLGVVLHQQGKHQATVTCWRQALRLQPNHPVILVRTAWVLATSPEASVRNGAEAIALAERALQFSRGETPEMLNVLAAAYAEAGRFSDATETAKRALAMVSATNPGLADALRDRVKLYQTGSAFRESRRGPAASQNCTNSPK